VEDVRIERVLRAVECVPEGRAATYGTLGRICGESPRVVGRVLSLWGSNVAWWRVVNAAGTIPGHGAEATPLWRSEGLLAAGAGRSRSEPAVDLKRVAADEEELRRRWEAAVADLEG
jgi:methylated-DNA-protein-cysteine methyltransferase related protein